MVSEPKPEVTKFPYEHIAAAGGEMPDVMEYPDQIAFLLLRELYAQLRQGIIDRDTAIREKRKISREYDAYKIAEQTGKQWIEAIKATELARAEFRKNPTVENGHKLVKAIDGVM